MTPLREEAFVVRNARVPAALAGLTGMGLATLDLHVAGGMLQAMGGQGRPLPADAPVFDAEHGIVLPRLVDVHTHLDKGHIWQRRPNPDGTFMGAIASVAADRAANWSAADVEARMDFALRCAFVHGTAAIRTHIDSIGPQTAISWPVFAAMREAWRGRIALQAVALFPISMALDDPRQFRALVATVAGHEGVLGGLTFEGQAPDARFEAALESVLEAAAAEGLDLDFHVDESASPDARTLERIAEAASRRRFRGRIVAGHCCSLALMADAERERVIARVVEAGITVASLPLANLYLQDRQAGRTPRWRGVAPLHEIASAGGATVVASDNTRDPFFAYGDLDLLEVFREATRILHFDHSPVDWLQAITLTPAHAMRLPRHGRLALNEPADLIVTRARTLNELLSRPQVDRRVLVAGRLLDAPLPDYRELDAFLPSPET